MRQSYANNSRYNINLGPATLFVEKTFIRFKYVARTLQISFEF